MLRMWTRWLSEARTLGSHRPAVAVTCTDDVGVDGSASLLLPPSTFHAAAARYVDLNKGNRQSAGRTGGPVAQLCCFMVLCCCVVWSVSVCGCVC